MNFRRNGVSPHPILFNVTAFVDVLLVLCFFFLLTWSNRAKETDLTVSLPQSAQNAAKTMPPSPVIVNVRASGELAINSRVVTMDELKEMVGKLAKLNSDQTVVIRADKRSQYEQVLSVLDTCQAAGVSSVGFAASVPVTKP